MFCGIGSKKIKAEVIDEDEHSLAFLDVKPLAPGHTVVIPKDHAYGLMELSDEQVGPLFQAVKRVMIKQKAACQADAFTIGINNGRMSGQMVDHLHVHVIPRFKGDGGGNIHSIFPRS